MKFNDDQLKEIFKDCNVITDFKFDSENGIITINKSDPLISVTEIKIEKKEGQKYSEVTLKFDANVIVNGRMLLESMICNNKMEKINNLLHE